MMRSPAAGILVRNCALFILSSVLFLTVGCGPKTVKTGSIAALEKYVTEAKQPVSPDGRSDGSLWVNSAQRSDLFRDPKARDINDMVTIRVIESTAASAVANAQNSKNASAQTSVNNLFGLENKIKELPSLVNAKTNNSYEGKGSTSRVTSVQTNLAARVVDVLPNGYLVVEGVKEIRLNNETQSVFLTGVVRPEDISRDNVILSSDVAQMTVRLQGKGVVSQTLKPGWLYSLLNGILPF